MSVLGTYAASDTATTSQPARPAVQKPKTVALEAPAKEIHAPAPKSVPAPSPAPSAQSPASSKAGAADAPQAEEATAKKPKKVPVPAGSADFDWQKILLHVKDTSLALHSVLVKCTPELEGATLTLYTGSAFFKKKIDDTKYSTAFHEALQSLGMPELEVVTLPTAAPLKDSQAAAIADIMGGGVEVSV